jgi:pimeloyl-ACP methyl ester carboxylesterase
MSIARLSGVELYYEETGAGVPLVWSHEFGGDHRSWEPQVRYFARGYRVVTYNHRGYAPSSVPVEARAYSPNIEEPGLFNLHVAEFLAAVERGRWAGWAAQTTSA